jgi:hypothetical protein
MCRFMRVSVMLFLTGCSASKTAYSDPATERAMLRQIQNEKRGLGIFTCDEVQHSAAMCSCLTTMIVDVMSDSEVHAVLYWDREQERSSKHRNPHDLAPHQPRSYESMPH